MKTKQVSLAILASMTLFACNNNDDLNVQGVDNAPKTVVMKLDGFSNLSRSTDAPTTDDSGTGAKTHAVSVSDIAVILYDANGNIYKYDPITVDDTENSAWDQITSETGRKYEGVDPNVDRVMVIGNTSTISGLATTAAVGEEISKVKALTIDLKSQNQAGTGDDKTTKGNLTLYGDAELTRDYDQETTNNDGIEVYSAHVDILPLIARVEVKNIKCTFKPDGAPITGISSFDVLGIGIVDYYNQLTLGTQAVVENSWMDAKTTSNADGKILPPSTQETPADGSYIFCKQTDPDTNWSWAFDNITGSTLTSTGNENDVQTVEKTFAYNFFPSTEIANVRLYLQSNNNDRFVVTANFNQAPQRGYIYQFEYAFDETVPGSWDKDQKNVYITVTAVPFTIVDVTPDFQ